MVTTAGIYIRVSTPAQKSITLQKRRIRSYVRKRGWKIGIEAVEVGSGSKKRHEREELLKAARRREIDVIVVWKLDRWGRSVTDLLGTLTELRELEIGFVSITEALDFTTPTGRALAGLLSIFAEFEHDILRERVKAGLEEAKRQGKQLGRPSKIRANADEIEYLHRKGLSKSEIARRIGLSRRTVQRAIEQKA